MSLTADYNSEIDGLPHYPMRAPCRFCGEKSNGRMRERSGQTVVFCAGCRRHVYCAPKSETGKPQRSVKSRPDLGGWTRDRIHTLDFYRCQLCGKTAADDQVNLHVGHMISVSEGTASGLGKDELYADENLFTMCEECNLAWSGKSLPGELRWRLMRARMSRNGLPTGKP